LKKKPKKRTVVHASSTDIANGRALYHIADGESLDSLVLGNASRAVAATNKVDVPAAFLVAPAISSFCGLHEG
jgi:hypothetical protein